MYTTAQRRRTVRSRLMEKSRFSGHSLDLLVTFMYEDISMAEADNRVNHWGPDRINVLLLHGQHC